MNTKLKESTSRTNTALFLSGQVASKASSKLVQSRLWHWLKSEAGEGWRKRNTQRRATGVKSVSLTMLTGAPKTERIVELNGGGYEQRNKAVVKSDVTPNWP